MPEPTPAEWQAAWQATADALARAARDCRRADTLLRPHLYEDGRAFVRLTDALATLADDLHSRALDQVGNWQEATLAPPASEAD